MATSTKSGTSKNGTSPKGNSPKVNDLPGSVWSALGPVRVAIVKKLRTKKKKKKLMGLWNPIERTIYIRADMNPRAMLATIAHEWVHVILWDAGVSLTEKQEESVADALSTGIIADLMSR